MRINKRLQLRLWTFALAAFLVMGHSPVKAQSVTYTNTFDAASSFQTTENDFPPPIALYIDPSSDTTSNLVAWSNGHAPGGYDDTAATGGPTAQGTYGDTGGSVLLSQTFDASAVGQQISYLIVDLFNPGEVITAVSFNLLVSPGSAADSLGGYGTFTVDAVGSYEGNIGYETLYSEELGNPSLSGPTDGTWENISVAIPNPPSLPMNTLDFDIFDQTSSINGPVTYYLDNLSVTYSVPEPASLGLLGLGLPALMMRRRARG